MGPDRVLFAPKEAKESVCMCVSLYLLCYFVVVWAIVAGGSFLLYFSQKWNTSGFCQRRKLRAESCNI